MVPRAVLMKSGLVSVNTARQVNVAHSKTTMNAARPMSYLSKTTHSTTMERFGKITEKGTIKTGNLDFENVYFVRELKFNLFSVSQMCDKKNSVLFNDTECIVLSPNFKLTDESHVLLKVPRKNNMSSVDLKNIVPKGGKARMEIVLGKDYILLPLWTADLLFSQSSKSFPDVGFKPSGDNEKNVTEEPGKEGGDSSKDSKCSNQEKEDNKQNLA
ncbi:hypothetical protein Tco_0958561 [Tanacetum coccineum]